MDGLLRKLVLGNPEVTAIWLMLILVAVVAVFWMFGPGLRQRSKDAQRLREASILRRDRLRQQAHDDSRYASEVSVAAQRARDRELQLRSRWLAVQQQTDSAWRAYDAAETELLRLAPAAAIPLTAESDEFCKHELQRFATAACLRGELSPLDYSAVLKSEGPWDPRRHPADQEIAVRRRVRRDRHAEWQTVAARERGAWQAYATAAVQASSLSDEACAARRRAEQTEQLLAVAIADRTKKASQEKAARGLIQA